jgi:hypothetical protein
VACSDDTPATGGFVDPGAAGTAAAGRGGSSAGGNGSTAGRGGTAGLAGSAGSAGSFQGGGAAGTSSGGASGADSGGAAGSASLGGTGGLAGAGDAGGVSGKGGGAGTFTFAGSGGVEQGGGAQGGSSAGNGPGGNGGNAGTGVAFGGNGGAAGSSASDCSGNAGGAIGAAFALTVSDPVEDDTLAAVTPDELTLVWFRGTAASPTLWVADRASTAVGWSSPVAVPGGPFALDRVATERKGLRLGALKADRSGFVELTRAARGQPFTVADGATFANLSAELPADAKLYDPVVGENDATLFYSIVSPSSPPSAATIFFATRFNPSSVWPSRTPSDEAPFAPVDGKRRRPTGLSADGRGLFFYDESTSLTRLATRGPGPITPFTLFTDVGPYEAAQPTTSCKRIYYSQKVGASVDLFSIDAP